MRNEVRAYHCVGDTGGQPLHCHEEVEMIAVYRGQGRFQFRNSRHTTGPGIFSLVCPQEPHAGTPANADFAVKVLNISVEWFAAMELNWRVLWRKGAVCETTSALPAFLQTYETVEHSHSRLMTEEALLTLHTILQNASPLPNVAEPKRIANAVAMLQDRFTDELSLTELAAAVELAPAYLCRVFTKTLGLSPHAYQISLRVARAKTLLENGTSPGVAAQEVGFYDQSHLSLHFKRLLGTTPARIAQRSNSSYTPPMSSE